MIKTEIAVLSPPTHYPAGFSIERYTADRKSEWNAFVRAAKNATFLFDRDYMEYHSDRFEDYSLMVFWDGKLMALLPANLNADGVVVSHGGLTYGGLIVSRPATLWRVMACFYVGLRYLREQGIKTLLYRPIPSIYSTLPNDDMEFVLYLLKAHLFQRDSTVAINQADRLPFRKGRKSEISKGRRHSVRLTQETDFVPFWEQVLTPRLTCYYGVMPVHSIDEITLLAARFPENIKQFSAYYEDQIVAGATVYETPGVARTQYIAVTDIGQKTGALDYLFGWLIDERYKGKLYFDFGSCNKSDRLTLNMGLLGWKESFGARCYSHDFYEIATENYTKLETVLHNKPEHA